jgi:hypothetical protein
MNRLSIRKSVRNDARAVNAGEPEDAHKDDAENTEREGSRMARLPFHLAPQYDWMDHHSIFETSEW